ncbi:MAG: hypothetical protein ACOC1G_08575 [Phycisphaeraceae bacterium]
MAEPLTLVLAAAGDGADAAEASGGGLGFIEAGLLIFFVVFVVIVAWTLMGRKGRFDREAHIPLSDEPVTPIDDPKRGGA